MFKHFYYYHKLFIVRGLLSLAVLLLVGCDLGLGGPRSAAEKYVQTLVEQPEKLSNAAKVMSLLPNQVILEYARALHLQGIEQNYRSSIVSDDEDNKTEVAVSIIPDRPESFNEREHVLIVELERDKEQGWMVIGIKAAP